MHLRLRQRRSAKQSNPLLIFPLGLAVIVSAMPTNALAFETHLADVRGAILLAPVSIIRPDVKLVEFPTVQPEVSPAAPQAVIARAVPITNPGEWASVKPITPVIETPVPVQLPSTPVATASGDGSPILTLEGEASYYSRAGCLGCDAAMIMANGQPLDDSRLTMAIGANLKHLVGRTAQVTSLATGKSVQVLITDTGGFYQAKYGSRVADLTVAAKTAIGMRGGVGQVRVEVF